MIRKEIKNLIILNRSNEINFSNLSNDEKKWILEYKKKIICKDDIDE